MDNLIKSNDDNNKERTQATQHKVIGQGSYGCVIKPAYSKSSTIKQDKISKISLIDETNEKEIQMGEKIKKIPKYNIFFSPILSSEPLYLHSSKNIETQDCHMVIDYEKKNAPESSKGNKYMVNTINYIGKHLLDEHFIELLKTKNFRYIIGHLIQCHCHLLKGLMKLKNNNIIHFDLNSGNIMISDKKYTPIFIDFGLAFEATDKGISLDPTDSPFFTHSNDYNPWCIDIIFISYYIHKKDKQLHEITIDSKELMSLVNSQIQLKSSIFSRYMNTNQVNEYKYNLKTFISDWNGKKAIDLYYELYHKRFSWDNYAVSILMLKIIKNMGSYTPFVKRYESILINVLVAAPNKRMDAEATLKEVMNLPKQTKLLDGTQIANMRKKIRTQDIIHNLNNSIVEDKRRQLELTQ